MYWPDFSFKSSKDSDLNPSKTMRIFGAKIQKVPKMKNP